VTELLGRHDRHVFYTWSAQRAGHPLEIIEAGGARFRTADGAAWIDLGSMTWNANLGHAHPAMRRALVATAERGLVPYPSAIFPEKVRAGELLAEIAPAGMGAGKKAFICLSGAEANENAVKIARLFTGRHRVVTRTRSYHGATAAMLSLSGDPRNAAFEPGYPGTVRWNDPYSAAPCAGDLDELLAREDASTIAAVLLEGVVGANGLLVPPPGYFTRVREVCDRHGVLLIADEVLSGMGRTGKWWTLDHDGVAPDLLTSAKGLTAGYAPGGAVVVNERIARHFDDVVLVCGLTAYAHPLTCAAIVAAVGAYRDEKLIERAAMLGSALGQMLRREGGRRKAVKEVRGIGLLWAVELAVDAATADRVADALAARHLHMHRRGPMFYVAPPFVIQEADLDAACGRLWEAVDEVVPS